MLDIKPFKTLKTAPIEKLMNLPLIGPKLAEKIKDQVGGFLKKGEWKQKALTEY